MGCDCDLPTTPPGGNGSPPQEKGASGLSPPVAPRGSEGRVGNGSVGTTVRGVLESLDLPRTLQERINVTRDARIQPNPENKERSFILYLPTVVIRNEHNPALAVACRLANHYRLPLLILGVVLDDAHHHEHLKKPLPPPSGGGEAVAASDLSDSPVVAATARRLTFTLQAYQKAMEDWHEKLGAGVLLRVHAPKARTPHHLSLCQRALVCVTDEPFVYPYRGFAESVERCCTTTPCIRVDGSTTVPPISKLTPVPDSGSSHMTYKGVPPKAWMWEKMTASKRRGHVLGAVKDGHLDAPPLIVKCPRDLLIEGRNPLSPFLPKDWRLPSSGSTNDIGLNAAPAKRPWTLDELLAIQPEEWTMQCWPGADTTVPPCRQTHGAHGLGRWQRFLHSGLKDYAKKRNDITQPHAVRYALSSWEAQFRQKQKMTRCTIITYLH